MIDGKTYVSKLSSVTGISAKNAILAGLRPTVIVNSPNGKSARDDLFSRGAAGLVLVSYKRSRDAVSMPH